MPSYPTAPKLRAALAEHRSKHNLTNPKFAKILGVTPTFLSKYINDNLDHNPKNFDLEAWDVLKAIDKRLELADELFDTSVTNEIHGRFNFIRKTSDIGLIHGRAGIGKTSSNLLYMERNPSTPYICLNARIRSARELEKAVFNSIENRDWNGTGSMSRLDYLVDRFAGSQRLIILDNIQRLNSDGLSWLFDFHDAAENGIACTGNTEILDKIISSDQHSSRFGICKEIQPPHDAEISDVATRVAAQFSDLETAEQISDLVAFIAKKDGHLRSVRKEVILMQALRDLKPALAKDPRLALRTAHKELVRNYDLPM